MSAYQVTRTILENSHGKFEFYCFAWSVHEEDNVLCLVKGPTTARPLLRIQSACYTSEIFRSLDCDCHEQLEQSLARVQAAGGILIYMLCDGRGAGLFKKVQGLELGRVKGLDTSAAYAELGVPQDPRDYTRAVEVLRHFGIKEVRLLTNNPRKAAGLEQHGIAVFREPIEILATVHSRHYLQTKARKMGHHFTQFDGPPGPSDWQYNSEPTKCPIA